MYLPADSEFMAGQAFIGMPRGFNVEFDSLKIVHFRVAPRHVRQRERDAAQLWSQRAADARDTATGCDFVKPV